MDDTIRALVTVSFCSEGGERTEEEFTFSEGQGLTLDGVRRVLTQLRDIGALYSFSIRQALP